MHEINSTKTERGLHVFGEFCTGAKAEAVPTPRVNGNLCVIGSRAVKFASGLARVNARRSRFSRVNTANPANRAW